MAKSTLTPKQRAFCEYFLANGFNRTKAARQAGYKGNDVTLASVGYENLRKPQIAAYIAERMKAMAMSADEAMARLSQTARADLTEYLGLSVAELKAHPQPQLVKKFKRTLTTYGELPSAMTEEKIEIELYDAQAAQLAIIKEQHLRAGEATDSTDVHLKVPPLPDDQLDHIFNRKNAPGTGTGPNEPDDL